jgi:hypothetical protein
MTACVSHLLPRSEPDAIRGVYHAVLPPEIASGTSNGQSLAFDLLRTVRLSLRAISKYGKHGPTS